MERVRLQIAGELCPGHFLPDTHLLTPDRTGLFGAFCNSFNVAISRCARFSQPGTDTFSRNRVHMAGRAHAMPFYNKGDSQQANID
jgi:hypothetical protein